MIFTYNNPKGAYMWETTLIGKSSDVAYFLELKDILKQTLNKEAIVVITFENDLICSIAISDESYKDFLITAIFETMIKIVKAEYYQANLKIFSDDKSVNSFLLSSLVLINLIEEVEYAKAYTKLSTTINIRSFIYFRLHKLLKVWKKEIEYYNKNFSGEYKDGLYLEFLRYLAQNSKSNLELIYLEENKKEMILLDKKKQQMKAISKDDEIGIIVSLVMYAPKKLIINCMDCLSNKVSKLISYIFEDRVSLIL